MYYSLWTWILIFLILICAVIIIIEIVALLYVIASYIYDRLDKNLLGLKAELASNPRRLELFIAGLSFLCRLFLFTFMDSLVPLDYGIFSVCHYTAESNLLFNYLQQLVNFDKVIDRQTADLTEKIATHGNNYRLAVNERHDISDYTRAMDSYQQLERSLHTLEQTVSNKIAYLDGASRDFSPEVFAERAFSHRYPKVTDAINSANNTLNTLVI